MAPYFSDSGEMNPESPDLYTDVADHITEPDRQLQEDRGRREQIGLGKKPEPAPKDAGKPGATQPLTREQQGDRWEAMRARLIAEPGLAEDAAFMDEFARMASGSQGHSAEAGQEVVGELFEGARIRELGADALSPAPRPALPEGFEFDETALVLAETEAHAMGASPALIMEITDSLRDVAERAEARGVGWAPEDAEAELERRHGREGAAHVADNARFAYSVLLESEHPAIVERVRELGEGWGDDPGVITLFGTTIYEAIRNAPMTPKLEALLTKREERLARAETAARAEAEQIRRKQAAEDDEARAASMAATALAHRRWGRTEP